MKKTIAIAVWVIGTLAQAQVVASGNQSAPLRGVYEVVLTSEHKPVKPFQPGLVQVTFTQPNGTDVTVDAFYDGGSVFKARAYCGQPGEWTWHCRSRDTSLNGMHGIFNVIESNLPGKLRLHPKDSQQFVFDNGKWFLHIGDTGYRYLTTTEKNWKSYIDQAVTMGATKIRTWFCQGRSDVQILFSDERSTLNLEYWQEMNRRLTYALEQYPQIQFQLIPYGEDTEELKRYAANDKMAKLVAQYAQARFSAYPNVQWCISNDREVISEGEESGREILASTIQQIAQDMCRREPWGTLLTNHQSRFSGYHFPKAEWSDITTLEDLDQVTGALILKYRNRSDTPVLLDEDRYETYREPQYPRYYFRRLMWASLLSGGHATYGGYRTYEAHAISQTGENGKEEADLRGIQGYYDGNAKLVGANDFVYIHRFFQDAQLTLTGLTPDDAFAGGIPGHFKCIRNEKVCVIYLANPDHSSPGSAMAADTIANLEILLPASTAKWFSPSTGKWSEELQLSKGIQNLKTPSGGDWVLLIRFSSYPDFCTIENPADMIIINGKILTVDEHFTSAEAVAIKEDKIIAVGSNRDISRLADGNSKIIDAAGRTVIPGLIDAHLHPEMASLSEIEETIPDVHSISELLDWIRSQTMIKQEGEWIIFPKMFFTRLIDLRQPTLSELDSVAPLHPVFLNGSFGGMINSAAMHVSGINEKTVHKGILKDEKRGKLTGFIRASDFHMLHIPPQKAISPQEREDALLAMFKRYNQYGITSLCSGAGDFESFA
ncbi:MAG: amidohydrolase family protein, partial [Bacteroidota bacterium]|nr:amidohydrolase family protein [Bacteroidota bacterium]